MVKKAVVIIAGSAIEDMKFLRQRIEAAAPEAVLCADGGARYAHALGLAPDLIIGDMDSLDNELLRVFEEKGIAIVRYPVRKDETDTQLALIQALAMNPEEILIFGAMGKRLDHTLANLGLLMMGLEKGVPIKLLDENCEVFVMAGAATVSGKKGQTVSIFPWGGEARGITLEGFEYPLEDATMTLARPCGISNRLTEKVGRIKVDEGYLLIIHYLTAS
ncbi:MAG: thiamine diphosphokinase [Syntrophales bacterium]|jgi:thiamine pyrophosphokinase|nr:thiamine diphosphokinase [Syntrophales bacterium]